jgi:hypothetical protein
MSTDNRNHQVSLGCGTLILIALIVMFFSNRSNHDVSPEINSLKYELSEVKTAIEAQTIEIKLLQQKLDKLQAK